MKKTCTICKKHLLLELYHIQSNRKDGRDSRCKSCVSLLKIKNYKIKKITEQVIQNHEELLIEDDVLSSEAVGKLLFFLEMYE